MGSGAPNHWERILHIFASELRLDIPSCVLHSNKLAFRPITLMKQVNISVGRFNGS